MHIKLPYSEQSGHIPSADRLKVGELWINGADNIIGTKKQNEQVVQFAQLTPEQRERVLNDYIPKHGVVDKVSVGQTATKIEGKNDAVTIDINDDSDTAIEYTVTNSALTINIEKTTGHKATKLVISKPASQPVVITWNGVDHWLSTAGVPTFGESLELEELCVAIFTSSTINCVNVIYNTEAVGSTDDEVVWGMIGGSLYDQEDLQAALNSKLSVNVAAETYLKKTDKAESAKKADEAIKATQDSEGNVISSTYATKNEVTQGLAGKANASHTHTTAQVTGLDTALAGKEDKGTCLPLSGGNITGALHLKDGGQLYQDKDLKDNNYGYTVLTSNGDGTALNSCALYLANPDSLDKGTIILRYTDGSGVNHELAMKGVTDEFFWNSRSVETISGLGDTYIRYSNGLQIVFDRVIIPRGGTIIYNYPVPFAGFVSVASGQNQKDDINAVYWANTTQCEVASDWTMNEKNEISIVAIGRWK